MEIIYKGETIVKSWGAKKALYIVQGGPTFTSLKSAKSWIKSIHAKLAGV